MRVADGGGGAVPASMEIEVPTEALLETAQGLENAANTLATWLTLNAHRLFVLPPGNDQVSKDMAKRLNDSAFGDMGVVPAANKAVDNLRDAARQMRANAALYDNTDHRTAAQLGSTGA